MSIRAPSARALLAVAACLALLAVAAGILVPTETWASWLEHPIRTHHRGGVRAESTWAAAQAWRIALVAGGVLAVLLSAAIVRGSSTRRDGSTPSSARTIPGLVALMCLALALRLPRLGESLWYDEIAAFLSFGQFGIGPTMGNYFTQSNHVLYGILSWIAVMVAGSANEIVLRLPALLASLACVPAMWWLGREATVSRGAPAGRAGETEPNGTPRGVASTGSIGALVPWTAAVIAAIAPVWVLQVEARGYVLMVLGAAVATALWLRAARLDGAATRLAYAVVVALTAWAHLVSIGIALGHGVLAAVDLVRDRPTSIIRSGSISTVARGSPVVPLLTLLLAAVLTVVLYAPILPDMLAIRSEFRALDGNEPALLGPEGVHALFQLGGAWWWWAALPGGLLALAGVMDLVVVRTIESAGPRAGDRRPARRAVLAALAGVPVVVLLAAAGGSWLYARFLLFALPGAALLMAFGFAFVLRRGGTVAGAVVALVVAAPWILDLALRPQKQPLRDAVIEVADARHPGERVLAIGLPDPVLMWYGLQRELEITPTAPLGADLDARLADREGRDTAWVILLYPRSVAPERFDTLQREGFELVTRHRGWVDWDNGDVLVYRRGSPRGG